VKLCSSASGGRTVRVEVSSAIGAEVDGMREPGGTCRCTEPAKASWASRELQVPQGATKDDDASNSADPAYPEIAESEQGYPRHGNRDADNDYRQRAAGAAFEVGTDGLSHDPQCYRLAPWVAECVGGTPWAGEHGSLNRVYGR
jgi:hypothetical protein